MSAKCLIVALDTAEPLLVRELVERGELPVLQSLMESGCTIDIENYPGFGNGAFWSSLNTGADPSFHSRYFRRQPRPGDFSLEPFHEVDFKLPPFWQALDRKGMKTVVIDPVESPAAHPENGLEIMEWMSHGRVELARSTPADLIDEILHTYGDDQFDGNADLAAKNGLSAEEVTYLAWERIQAKTAAMLDLLDRDEWDLFYVTFADPHDVGHLAWHLHQPGKTDSGVDSNKKEPDLFEQCYIRLDESLSKLKDKVLPGGQIIVLMGPGIEKYVSANTLLPEILRKFQGRKKRGLLNRLTGGLRRIAQNPIVPASIRNSLNSSRARLGYKVRNLSGTRFFTVPHNDNAGAIRINLSGRDPHGVVAEGDEYDDLCRDLIERLMLIRDASGKIPLVKEVIKMHDYLNGPYLDLMPDLFVIWNREADVSEVSSPEIGKLVRKSSSARTGDHSTRSMLVSDRKVCSDLTAPLAPDEVTQILLQGIEMAARNTENSGKKYRTAG